MQNSTFYPNPSYTAPLEPYGNVQHLAQRRSAATQTQENASPLQSIRPTYASVTPTGYTPAYQANLPRPPPLESAATQNKHEAKPSYRFNTHMAFFLVPSIISVLFSFTSRAPFRACWVTFLLLYSMDLANLRELLLFTTCLSVLVMTLVSGWCRLIEANEASEGLEVLYMILQMGVYACLWALTAIWLCLNMAWIQKNKGLQIALHSAAPLVSAAVLAQTITIHMSKDTGAKLLPYIFCGVLCAAMYFLGSVFYRNDLLLTSSIRLWHTVLLILVPPLMHFAICFQRIVSRYASTDDWYDMVLVTTIPILLFLFVHQHQSSPYKLSVFADASESTVPAIVALVASFALQQRHLVGVCHQISYHFMGVRAPVWLISLYWTLATICGLAAHWLWGRQSKVTNALLLGEYHEDAVQLLISGVGLTLGKAFGLPWNFVPLPILAFLGLALWISSRMLRYLSIFLFVVHAVGVVVFTYRFAGMDEKIVVVGFEMRLMRFGFLATLTSIGAGLLAGLSVRSNGGYGTTILKRVDGTGIVLILYSLALMILELSLIKRLIPMTELVGAETQAFEIEENEMVYDHDWSIITAGLLLVMSVFMAKVRIITQRSAAVAVSLAVGKAIAVFVDASEIDELGDGSSALQVFLRSLVAALLCTVALAPRVFLTPVHIKATSRLKRGIASGGGGFPEGTLKRILLYAFIFVPLALAVSIPYVLMPLLGVLRADSGGHSVYSIRTPISDLIGVSISLWGLSCLSTLNFYLPDGGGEAFKKVSALAFLMGISILFAAPTIGFHAGVKANNPYLALSSIGSQMIHKSKQHTGGWGLLSAALATLLAVAGPLDLRERRGQAGHKDKYLLLRTMAFSVLFGCGVGWFVLMQCMSESDWLHLVLTSVSCMTMAFLGTVAAVLGFFLQPDELEEVEQISKIWIGTFVLLIPFTGLPNVMREESMAAFGVGGWFSTYLIVSALSAIGFSAALQNRSLRDRTSRSMSNFFCVVSWVCCISVVFGRFGIAGLDSNYDVTTFAGIPASVAVTLLVSPLLLGLQSESTDGKGRVKRLNASAHPSTGRWFGIDLPNLRKENKLYPLLIGSVVVFLLAALYAVFLRGSSAPFGARTVAKSHEDVFRHVFGNDFAELDLATLVEKTISHSKALTTSSKLAGSGFWTASGLFGPVLHVIGILACLPSHYLQCAQWWLNQRVSPSSVALTLPINAVPIFLCRGIPSLQAAAFLGVSAGCFQLSSLRQAEKESRMRI